MAAQQGDAILLAYGPQGSQQAGATIVLSYQAAPAPGRRLTAGTAAPWGAAAAATLGIHAHHAATAEIIHPAGAPWPPGRGQNTEADAHWGVAKPTDNHRAAPWPAFGRPAQPEPTSRWGVSAARDDRRASHWGRFTGRAQHTPRAPWVVSIPRDHREAAPWLGPMAAFGPAILAIVVPSAPADQLDHSPWSLYSRQLDPGWGVVIPPDPRPPPGEPVIIPVRKVYIMQNEVLLLRVSDQASIPATSMTLRLDADSWAWGFTATIPGAALPLVEPQNGQPVELEAIINGVQFRILAERLARERQFGRADISISGRGKAATLAAPYAPAQTFDNAGQSQTAQQLAAAVLTVNGVPLPWTIDWQMTDWIVPAGAWSHQGTYIDAMARIAQAAGGYLRPDPLADTIAFLHRYPTMPETWAAIQSPDFTLPASITTRESIEWEDLPAYDAVYVSGVQAGVLANVKRAGSAGTNFAPMVTDPLITATEAARQRGQSILAETGRRASVTLRLPMLEAMGLIEPGHFVRYTDAVATRTGIVRATSIETGRPGIWQTIQLETHHA